jgi:hypothetical protein
VTAEEKSESVEKLKIASEIISAYLKRTTEKVQQYEFEAVKTACDYVIKNLK